MELWERLKLDPTDKWDTNKLDYDLENETYNILLDLQSQTNHLFLARKSNILFSIKKKLLMDFGVSKDHRVKMKARKGLDKHFDLSREPKCRGIRKWRWYQS